MMPVCHECDIKMAIHMDDPPWDIFGLPRLLVDAEAIDRFLSMVDDPYNCLTLCSGSLGANPKNNVAEIVRKHCDRIAFAHIRNVKHFPNGDFSEACPPGLRRRHRYPGHREGLPRLRLRGLHPPRPRPPAVGRGPRHLPSRLRPV